MHMNRDIKYVKRIIAIIHLVLLPTWLIPVYAHGFSNLGGLTDNHFDLINQASSDIYHYPDDNKLGEKQILDFI